LNFGEQLATGLRKKRMEASIQKITKSRKDEPRFRTVYSPSYLTLVRFSWKKF
jgi:hypothetical protein